MSAARGRVLHLIDTTGPGGAETVFLQLAHGLRERGWEARLAITGPGWVLNRARELGLPADVVPTDRRLDLRYGMALRRLVRDHGVQLIQAHLFSPAIYACAVGAWTRTPVVATFHGASDVEAGGFTRRQRYRLVDRRARVVCVSDSLRRKLAALKLIASPVEVIHNGVDAAAFPGQGREAVRHHQGVPRDAILVGALGNVRPAKDYANLLRAAAAIDDARVHFAIVGERTSPLYDDLVALRDRLGLAGRVSFWGFRDDVPDVMAAFDLLAISSSSEGFSIAAIQAMAAGLPVVATRSGGPEGIITDGEDGVLVDTGDAEALAAGIKRVMGSPAIADRLSKRARQTVADRFSLDRTLDAYERLYDELLGSRRHDRSTSGTNAANSSS